jgi:hypothetical protein
MAACELLSVLERREVLEEDECLEEIPSDFEIRVANAEV